MNKVRRAENSSVSEAACIEAVAPARIDLAGGTVDIWPLYLFHDGALTINAGISLYVRVRVAASNDGLFHVIDLNKGRTCTTTSVHAMKHKRGFKLFGWALHHFLPPAGVTVSYSTMVPEGAGLAGSSSLLVALCGALNHMTRTQYSRVRLLEILRDIETQLIGVPAGLQDYYPALWGGINAIRWDVGGGRREPVGLPVKDLEQWLMLVSTKTSRYSGANNWTIVKRHIEGDARIQRGLAKIVAATNMMREALSNRDYLKVGAAMDQEAAYRKQLVSSIMTPGIRRLEATAKSLGVLASKVCGAGGGGCVLLFLEPHRRESVRQRLIEAGYEIVPFRIARSGLAVRQVPVTALMG